MPDSQPVRACRQHSLGRGRWNRWGADQARPGRSRSGARVPRYNPIRLDRELQARRLHEIGLNAYESSAYIVLIGHRHFKALEVASRANIPRAKIYEVLNGLADKGFVRVRHGKVKHYSAIEPKLALEGYLNRRRESFLREWENRQQLATTLSRDLASIFQDGSHRRGQLDYLRIIADTRQIIEEYRFMLLQTANEYLEFARPPYGVDPGHEPIVKSLADKGVACRLMFDEREVETAGRRSELKLLEAAGADVYLATNLPMKLALFDGQSGMISLDDPVASHEKLTALVFEHRSLGSAMQTLFEDFSNRSLTLDGVPVGNGSSGNGHG